MAPSWYIAGNERLQGAVFSAPVSGAPFDLDGTPQNGNSGGSSTLVLPAFSNTFNNSLVYVAVVTNGGPVLSITGGPSFLPRVSPGPGNGIELWEASSALALTSTVLTVNTTSASFVTACVFAFSGAHFISPFDSNISIPAQHAASGALTYSTANANDIIIATARCGSSVQPVDPPFTSLFANNFLAVGYQIVTSTQTSASVTWATANLDSCVDAIIQGP